MKTKTDFLEAARNYSSAILLDGRRHPDSEAVVMAGWLAKKCVELAEHREILIDSCRVALKELEQLHNERPEDVSAIAFPVKLCIEQLRWAVGKSEGMADEEAVTYRLGYLKRPS